MKVKWFIVIAIIVVILLNACSTARAEDDRPELELILALDWSGSMYYNDDHRRPEQHWKIQRDGHIEALRDPVVTAALLRDKSFVRVILWAGVIDDIRELYANRIRTNSDLAALRAAFAEIPSRAAPDSGTNHAAVMAWVMRTPAMGRRRVLDISTDEGVFPPAMLETNRTYSRWLSSAPMGGVTTTVNVLAVTVAPENVKTLYDNVRSPDGFLHSIDSWGDYAAAIRRKLLLEVALRR